METTKRLPPSPATRSKAGANILDVNVDEGMIDGPAAMTRFLNQIGADPKHRPRADHG